MEKHAFALGLMIQFIELKTSSTSWVLKIPINKNQLAATLPFTVTAIPLQWQNHYGRRY